MTVFWLVLSLMAAIMALMAIGLFFRRPCLRGSCGGPEVLDENGESLSCAACPNRTQAERLSS